MPLVAGINCMFYTKENLILSPKKEPRYVIRFRFRHCTDLQDKANARLRELAPSGQNQDAGFTQPSLCLFLQVCSSVQTLLPQVCIVSMYACACNSLALTHEVHPDARSLLSRLLGVIVVQRRIPAPDFRWCSGLCIALGLGCYLFSDVVRTSMLNKTFVMSNLSLVQFIVDISINLF